MYWADIGLKWCQRERHCLILGNKVGN